MFKRHPESHFVEFNRKVTFECFVSGSNSSLIITWEKDGMKHNSNSVENTTHSNGVSSSLTIDRARMRDSGKYRCRATNVNGKSAVSTEAELISKLFYSR